MCVCVCVCVKRIQWDPYQSIQLIHQSGKFLWSFTVNDTYWCWCLTLEVDLLELKLYKTIVSMQHSLKMICDLKLIDMFLENYVGLLNCFEKLGMCLL